MINMGQSIPKSLRFVKDSLHDGEAKKWLGWYNNLTNPDKRNVGKFLRSSHDWMSDEGRDYFIVGAIGSTLNGTQYQDVDLLVVTNRIWRDMDSFEEELLEKRLSKDFEYVIDPTISEAYQQIGRPNRTLVTLNPRHNGGKSIHVTVQPEIRHEGSWREKDKKPSVVLYRIGDVTGYRDTIEYLAEGFRAMEQLAKSGKAD